MSPRAKPNPFQPCVGKGCFVDLQQELRLKARESQTERMLARDPVSSKLRQILAFRFVPVRFRRTHRWASSRRANRVRSSPPGAGFPRLVGRIIGSLGKGGGPTPLVWESCPGVLGRARRGSSSSICAPWGRSWLTGRAVSREPSIWNTTSTDYCRTSWLRLTSCSRRTGAGRLLKARSPQAARRW